MKSDGTLLGLRRGIAALDLMASRGRPLGFNELQKDLDLPAPTLARILKVLVDEDLVEQAGPGGRYGLGPEFMRIARTAAGSVSRAERLQPVLEQLGRGSGESAAYFELDKKALTLRAKAEQAESWHYSAVGNPNKRVTRNGFGQVCLAILAAGERDRHIAAAEELPAVPRAGFLTRLKKIVREGVFFEQGEANPSIIRFVAPVPLDSEDTAGAIGITMAKRKLSAAEKRRFSALVADAAEEATRLVGRQR